MLNIPTATPIAVRVRAFFIVSVLLRFAPKTDRLALVHFRLEKDTIRRLHRPWLGAQSLLDKDLPWAGGYGRSSRFVCLFGG
jgi:hypothetical protein